MNDLCPMCDHVAQQRCHACQVALAKQQILQATVDAIDLAQRGWIGPAIELLNSSGVLGDDDAWLMLMRYVQLMAAVDDLRHLVDSSLGENTAQAWADAVSGETS